MTPTIRTVLTFGLLVLGLWFWNVMKPVSQPAGILAPDAPNVQPVAGNPRVFERHGHVLTALAGFSAHARVLSIKRYGGDRAGEIAPLDITLGWGPLSDSATLKIVDIAQTERGVLFKSYDPKLPDAQLEAHLLNIHIIAADAELQEKLDDLKTGNVVRLEGFLVEAVASDGWGWKGNARAKAPPMPGTLLWLQKIEVS